LGLSLCVDLLFENFLASVPDWEYFLEDGLKWLGIVCWCSYFTGSCLHLIQDRIHEEKMIN
jgi:hypothetical protein